MGLEELCNYTILWAGVLIGIGLPLSITAYKRYAKVQKAKVRQGTSGDKALGTNKQRKKTSLL